MSKVGATIRFINAGKNSLLYGLLSMRSSYINQAKGKYHDIHKA